MGRKRLRLIAFLVVVFAYGMGVSAQEYKLTFPEAAGPNHAITLLDQRFAQYLEEESKGKIKTNVVPGGLFGTYESMLEQVQQGAVDFCIIGSSISGDVVPKIMITLMPFMYRTEEEVNYIVQQKEIMGPVEDAFYQKGIKIVNWSFASLRNTLTARKPLQTLDDFKGLKIRAPGRPILLAMKDLGANPIPMPFAEIHTAMQTGMVDAVERNTFVMQPEGWEKTVRYLNMDGHSGDVLAIAMNKGRWDKMTPDLKNAIERASKRASKWAYDYNLKANEDVVAFYQKHGIKVVTYTDQQMDQFVKATENARKILTAEIGADLVDKTAKLLEDYRRKKK
jgi:TRAP-type C4-dicarboxylate transport system substrate-binding protein